MKRFLLALAAVLLGPSSALATWSIVAVDMATGRVVIASATCVNGADDFLKGVQAVVVPGKGIAACQASVDGTHTRSEEHTSELQSQSNLVCRLLLEKKKNTKHTK